MVQKPDAYFKSIDHSRIVWITIINKGYIRYTQNFLKSMEIHNVSFTLAVYCLDNEIPMYLANFKNVVCLDASYFIKGLFDSSFTQWGTLSYKSLVFSKLDALKYSLELCKKYNIETLAYIDTDIIVLKDPSPIILRLMDNSELDIIHQCDEDIQLCSDSSMCPNMSSGVIGFRTSKIPSSIFDYCSADILQNTSDQHYIMNKIDELGIKRKSVYKHIFLNGIYPNLTTNYPLILHEKSSLIHFNCMIGNEKEYNMRLKGMWYI